MKYILLIMLLSNISPNKFLSEPPNPLYQTVQRTIFGQTLNLPAGDKFYVIPLDHNTPKDSKDAKLTCSGDGIILESNGKFAMIDLYRRGFYPAVHKFLKDLNVKELEFILFSHYHVDHRGNLEKLAKDFKVKAIYTKDGRKNNFLHEKYQAYYDFAIQNGITVNFVNEKDFPYFTFENMGIELHNRPLRPVIEKKQENGNSLTALVRTYQGRTMYFSGDIQRVTINGVVHNYGLDTAKEVGRVDVYKVAHHGKDEDNNLPEEIEILRPKYSVMTIDKKREVTTDRLKKVGSKVYRAGVHHDGVVVVNVDPFGEITVHTSK